MPNLCAFHHNHSSVGFVSDKNTDRIKNAPVVTVESAGRGKVISYHESMTFRGFWMGTNKLFDERRVFWKCYPLKFVIQSGKKANPVRTKFHVRLWLMELR
jgi:hypothetical protein